MSELASYLAAELGVRFVAEGETLFDLADANPGVFDELEPKRVAATLARGAQRDDAVGLACLDALVWTATIRDEPDLVDTDMFCARVGRHVVFDDAARWIERLLAAHTHEALETLRRLAEIRDPMPDDAHRAFAFAVMPLAVELDSPRVHGAASAITAIAKHHGQHAGDLGVIVTTLCDLLADDKLVYSAANTLAAIGDPRAIGPLIATLPAGGCANALALLGAKEAVPALSAALLATDDRNQRDELIYALVRIDLAGGANAIAQVADPNKMSAYVIDATEAGAAAGDAASRQFLIRASRSTERSMRARAIRALAALDGPARLDELCVLVDDPDAELRAYAINALVKLGDPRAFDALVRGLRQGHAHAATGLGQLRDARAVDPLLEVLAVEDGYYQMEVVMKEALVRALGDLGVDDERTWPALIGMLTHRSDHICEYAAVALQQLRPGCSAGHALIVRKLGYVANSEHHLKRELPPMLIRLNGAARSRETPHDRAAATAILAALRALRAYPQVHEAIETWTRWLG